MKRRQRDIFAAFAGGAHDAGFHFAGGFIRKGEAEDVFAGKRVVRLQKVADTFGDDASLAGAGARDDEQRAFAMSDGAALGVV